MVRYTRKGLLKGEENMGFLTGKTAIITGAGRAVLSDGRCGSIGYGIATAYAKEGANIVITLLRIENIAMIIIEYLLFFIYFLENQKNLLH